MPPTDAPLAVASPSQPLNLLALDQPAMERLVADLGWPRYRASQILRWLYRSRVTDIDHLTDLSKAQRSALRMRAGISRLHDVRMLASRDGTRKILARLEDGLLLESVLIPDDGRLTLCLSTQVGCSLDCRFCLTATMGLKRNLKAHEVVDQVLTAQDGLAPAERLSNLVLMGMGEPLANFAAVAEAIRRITNPVWGLGISARRVTVSTAGMATRLKDLSALGVNVAISLNAASEAQRDRLMPGVNRLHPLNRLLAACRAYPLPPNRRLTFEYVLLAGVNDTEQDAKTLAKLLQRLRCKVNLIPFNEFPGTEFRRPTDENVVRFQEVLHKGGLDVFVRKTKGRDVLGACGQLGDLPLALMPVAAHG